MKKAVLALSLSLVCALGVLSPALSQQTRTPIQAGGVSTVDIPDTKAKAITVSIKQGSFGEYSVGDLAMTMHDVDFRGGVLSNLDVLMNGALLDNVMIDKMTINTGGFTFDTFELLNKQRFVLAQPIVGQVSLRISEKGVNHFLRHPKTLSALDKAVTKATGGIKLLTFTNPTVDLLGAGRVKLTVTGNLAQGLLIPMEMNGAMAVENGVLVFNDLTLASNGTDLPIPVDVAKVLESKLNDLINLKKLGKKTFVMNAQSMSMTKDALDLDGTATMTRLEFGG